MQETIHYRNEATNLWETTLATNNIYYVDMEKRFQDFCENKIDPRALRVTVYDTNNVALALRQLSKSSGRMALGQDKSNYETSE